MKNLLFLFTLCFFIACSSSPTKEVAKTETATTEKVASPYKDIDVAQFKSRMGKPGVFILDVRTPAETNEGKIQGAVEVDFRAASFKNKISKLPRDKEYLVYCKSGGRSSKTAKMMEEMGFKNVSNLLGGYSVWVE